jgi:hypothetical protein
VNFGCSDDLGKRLRNRLHKTEIQVKCSSGLAAPVAGVVMIPMALTVALSTFPKSKQPLGPVFEWPLRSPWLMVRWWEMVNR